MLALHPIIVATTVANTSKNTVSIIDTNTNTVDKTLVVGSTAISAPEQFALNPNSTEIYVTLYGETFVVGIDSSTSAVHSPLPAGSSPMGIDVTADGKTMCVSNQDSNTVSLIDLRTKTIQATLSVGNKPSFVLISK